MGANKDAPLPAKLFEVGDVVLIDPEADVGARNSRRLLVLYCNQKAGFEVVHGVLDRVMTITGAAKGGDAGYEVEEASEPTYFPGDRRTSCEEEEDRDVRHRPPGRARQVRHRQPVLRARTRPRAAHGHRHVKSAEREVAVAEGERRRDDRTRRRAPRVTKLSSTRDEIANEPNEPNAARTSPLVRRDRRSANVESFRFRTSRRRRPSPGTVLSSRSGSSRRARAPPSRNALPPPRRRKNTPEALDPKLSTPSLAPPPTSAPPKYRC